ncbi:DUF397 domain-containing protein [Streptomyces sp. SID13726]|uniref:DUF397 domain-containing protein n=1 Tax=Streptomyces sp. SID13726 TaxID=2706058 RepID=UPI0013B7A8FA|nr:DUF397 domain-containing protein [Streptomyces sp. SID13726]NEB05024.1 DUF397 domain-containing protein [Streptomyces sp. SID13726]
MASTEIDLSTARWSKSSYSNGTGGDCVEVAQGFPGVIPVRDSKQAHDGPVLFLPSATWTAFVTSLRN